MNKQNVVFTYNGMLFSLKKEENPDTFYNMDEPREHYDKWNKSDRERQIPYGPTYTWNLKTRQKAIP